MPPLRLVIAIALVAAGFGFASLADAAPGDYRLLTGTVVWPDVTFERTLVVQSDDGVMHFAELAMAESSPRTQVGDRVSIIGREGFRPTHILFAQLASREPTGSAPAALPVTVAVTPVIDVRESPDIVTGTVESLAGRALRLTNRHGHRIEVDVAAIDPDVRQALRPGDAVTIYAPTRVTGLPVAAGIMVDHAPASAVPRP